VKQQRRRVSRHRTRRRPGADADESLRAIRGRLTARVSSPQPRGRVAAWRQS